MGNGGFDGGGYGREDSGICGGGCPQCDICEDGEESCGDDSEGMGRPLQICSIVNVCIYDIIRWVI